MKFVSELGDGSPLLGIGLSAENLQRLKLGQPILFQLAELGYELRRIPAGAAPTESSVFVMSAETERDMARMIGLELRQPGPGESTVVRFGADPKAGGA